MTTVTLGVTYRLMFSLDSDKLLSVSFILISVKNLLSPPQTGRKLTNLEIKNGFSAKKTTFFIKTPTLWVHKVGVYKSVDFLDQVY